MAKETINDQTNDLVLPTAPLEALRFDDVTTKTAETDTLNTVKEPELRFDTSKTNEDLLKYEMVKCPDHYHKYDKEVIDMMEQIWGCEAVINYCVLSAFKHRMSLGVRENSTDITIQQDLKKEQWYLSKVKELQKKLNK